MGTEKCRFCEQEPPTEKFYDEMEEFKVCRKCLDTLVDLWEDRERAIKRYDEYVEVLRGTLKRDELTPGF